jgi:hypothetical protein
MKNEVNFTRQLIKGKIVEMIFEMMMREMDRVTVLRAGYEYTHPGEYKIEESKVEEKVLSFI